MTNIDVSKQTGIAKSVLEAKAKNESNEKSFDESHDRRHDEWKSPQLDQLAAALAKAQSEMEGAKKESTNPFFKSSYADLHAVIKSSFPYLSKNGLSVSQGNEVIKGAVCVTTTLMHASGQWMRSKIKLPLAKVDAQGVGAAVTYGRRYGLSAMVGIAQYDDDAQSIS
ncbi:MAG: putative essential recombination function protein [Prokaryotic dsDNA virus sp.]|nr:MAG: putative essential recombination function protein [Prokaryotic dsDNA virus sp.]